MATDKRLSQVSTLTDFDYALIVKGDQVAKASKQQLAELVGNLLYGATNASSLATVVAGQTRFKTRDNDIDLNTIEADSWSFIGTSNSNKPDGTSNELAFVYTKDVGIYGSSIYIIQWYYGWNVGSNYIRKKHTGQWQPWEKL